MILVTGGTGNVGSHVVAGLCARGARVRAFVRDSTRAAARLGGGVELVAGNFENTASIRAAFEGVDSLFLATVNHPRQADHERTFIGEAVRRGVRRVVKLSSVGAETGSPLAFWDQHGRAEEYLKKSGVPWVSVRSSFYMTNLLSAAQQVREQGALFAPAGGAHIALTDPHDVADVAVVALTTEGHEDCTYTVTGPSALTYDEIAADLAATIGRPVSFVALSDEAAYSAFVASGMPAWFAQQLVMLFRLLRDGAAAATTDTVRALTGQEPRTFRQFLREHVGLFQLPLRATPP
jgi:uncharacterized protein YbjT (DUF2867 family)